MSVKTRGKLTRVHRLTSADVKRVLEKGRRVSLRVPNEQKAAIKTTFVSARCLDVPAEMGGVQARLAVAVPKRLLKRAVDRNRIKRWMREAFRQHDARSRVGDILMTLSSKPALHAAVTRAAVKQQLHALIAQIGSQRRPTAEKKY